MIRRVSPCEARVSPSESRHRSVRGHLVMVIVVTISTSAMTCTTTSRTCSCPCRVIRLKTLAVRPKSSTEHGSRGRMVGPRWSPWQDPWEPPEDCLLPLGRSWATADCVGVREDPVVGLPLDEAVGCPDLRSSDVTCTSSPPRWLLS